MQVREVVKHTPELAQLVVANGGVGALVEYCNDSTGNNRWVADRHSTCASRQNFCLKRLVSCVCLNAQPPSTSC